jgi:hypothetical protein
VVPYPAMLDVPRHVVEYLARLLVARRRAVGTPRRSRALGPFRQAVLVLRWFRERGCVHCLARDVNPRLVATSMRLPGVVRLSGLAYPGSCCARAGRGGGGCLVCLPVRHRCTGHASLRPLGKGAHSLCILLSMPSRSSWMDDPADRLRRVASVTALRTVLERLVGARQEHALGPPAPTFLGTEPQQVVKCVATTRMQTRRDDACGGNYHGTGRRQANGSDITQSSSVASRFGQPGG